MGGLLSSTNGNRLVQRRPLILPVDASMHIPCRNSFSHGGNDVLDRRPCARRDVLIGTDRASLAVKSICQDNIYELITCNGVLLSPIYRNRGNVKKE